MDAAPVIVVEDLHCRYGDRVALDGLSLQVPRGGVHALVGANGAGKSSLLRILLGFVPAQEGWAEVLGERCDALSPSLRARIAFVQEDHALPPAMRVGELLVVHQRRHARTWRADILSESVQRFALPTTQRITSLSRGERAGLALALALAQGPELLLLDEPTLGLDVVARRRFLETLLQLGLDPHCTVIYASHHMEEVERLAEQLVVLRGGRLLLQDTPEAVAARVTCWQAEFPFGTAALLAPLPGQLSYTSRGPMREWLLLDAEPGAVRAALSAAGAARIAHATVGLERAVAALLESRDA